MVSYDAYKNRIKKIAAVKNFIVKFRVLFICLSVLILGGIIALLSIKGMVTGNLTVPEEVVYGESYKVEGGSALMSSVKYEYSLAGSNEWTGEKPVKAGKYLARIVTQKSFGTKGHGSAVAFTIQPRPAEFVIRDTSVVYGSNPKDYKIDGLISGDTLNRAALSFSYESLETNETNISVDTASLQIFNGNREDVTYCYDVSAPSSPVTLSAKQLNVPDQSLNFTYSGEFVPYESEIETILQGYIVKGDEVVDMDITPVTRSAATQTLLTPGEYRVAVTVRSIVNGETDVSHLYETKTFLVTIVIKPRPITITTGSDEKDYDGTPLVCKEKWTEKGLIAGHKITQTGEEVSIVYADETRRGNNHYEYLIYAGNEDVTDCYQIQNEDGTLAVKPRPIAIKTKENGKWEYDGEAHTYSEYTILSGLVKGDEERLTYFRSIVDCGTVNNELDFAFYRANRNITSSYRVNGDWGTLTVTPRPLKIKTGTDKKVYDGTPLDGSDKNPEINGLVVGETYIANAFSITDAGTAENKTTYRIYSYGKETTDNYDIRYEYGTLTVAKRGLTIETFSASRVYDGTPFRYTDGRKADNLAPNQSLFVDTDKEIASVTNVSEGKVKNVVSYLVCDRYGNDVSKNYQINYLYNGYISVEKRALTIETATRSQEYNGKPFSYADDWAADNLAPNQTLSVDTTKKIASITNVGETENEVKYLVVDVNGNDVSGNYTCTYKNGVISVTAFTVDVTTATSSKIYDGTPYEDTSFAQSRTLPLDHQIVVDEAVKPAFVTTVSEGEKENKVAYRVVDGKKNDVTGNYALSVYCGKISISKRPLTITTGSADKVYDGKPLFNAVPDDVPCVEGQTYKLDFRFEMTDAGTKDNETTYRIFADGVETTGNYDISYVYGTLRIDRRPITITTENGKWEYDGAAHDNESAQSDDLVYGHKLSRNTPLVSITNVKESGKENYYIYDVLDSAGRTVTANYKITYKYGTLTITPRPITITTCTFDKIYDGTPLSGDAIDPSVADDDRRFLNKLGHILLPVQATCTQITDVLWKNGEVSSVLNQTQYRVYADGEDVSDNYKIQSVYGTLRIDPRNITITTVDGKWEYDGAAHSDSTASADGLVYSHELSRKTPLVEITNVKESGKENYYEYDVLDSARRNVTANYKITYVYGTLTITKRNITISTATDGREYNGEPYQKTDGFSINRPLTYSDETTRYTLSLDESRKDEFASVTNVYEGRVKNKVYFVVRNAKSEDVSENYEITYDWGEIYVTPYKLTVTTDSANKVYNGTPLQKLDGFTYDWLYTGHELVLDTLRADEFASITNVYDALDVNGGQIDEFGQGIIPNRLYFKVQSESDERANENYEIAYEEWGTLTVLPRLVTVTTGSAEKVYDAITLRGDSVSPIIAEFTETTGLLEGHALRATSNVTKITDVYYEDGEVSAVLNQTSYIVIADGKDISLNYMIDYFYGTLKITPRAIKITTPTKLDFEYNGTPYSYTTASADNLVGNQYLVPYYDTATTVTDVLDEAVDNVVYYSIQDLNGNNFTANYTIEYAWGKLNVVPRKITVTTGSGSRAYNGEPFTLPEYETADRLLSGHSLVPDESREDEFASVTNVYDGKVENAVYFVVLNEAGELISKNYEITYVLGEIYVTPYQLTVTTGSKMKGYNGTPLQKLDGFTADWLYTGHELVLDESRADEFASITNVYDGEISYSGGRAVGTIPNRLYFKIQSENDGRAGENYEIAHEEFGTLSIRARRTSAHGGSAEKEYDGTPLRGDSVPVEGDLRRLLEGHILVADQVAQITDVVWTEKGEVGYALNTTTFKVFAGDTDITLNYYFYYNYETESYGIGTLKITPRAITIKTETSVDTEYDGTPYSYTAGSAENLVENHVLVADLSTATTVTDVLEEAIDNVVHYFIYDEHGNNVTANYTVESETWGKLNRVPRRIEVITGTGVHEYDGKPFCYFDDVQAVDGRLISGHALVADPDREYATLTDIIWTDEGEVGSIPNVLSCLVIDGDGEDVSRNYEIVPHSYGTLTVIPREIIITTPTDEWDYNGEAHGNANVVANLLIAGHKLAVDGELVTITDAGEIPNEYNSFKITEGEKDVTRNYKIIDVRHGTLTVKPIEITVTLNQTQGGVYGDSIAPYVSGANNFERVVGIIAGEALEVAVYYTDESGNRVEPKNAGIYYVSIDAESSLIHKNGETTGTGNYVIKQEDSSFEIERRDLVISMLEVEGKEYDGKPYSYPQNHYAVTAGETAYGETLLIKVSYLDRGADLPVSAPIDAGTYLILFDETNSTISGVSADKNYNLTVENDGISYEITPRKISVLLDDVTRVYNGTQFDYLGEGHEIHVQNLLPNVRFNGTVLCNGFYVDEYDITLGDWSLVGDKVSNYELVSAENATLTITKRDIEVKVWFQGLYPNAAQSSVRIEQTGALIAVHERSYQSTSAKYGDGFVDGDDYKFTPKYTYTLGGVEVPPVERGFYNVAVSFEESDLIQENYNISYVGDGTMEITARLVSVIAEISDFEYNGKPLDTELLSYLHYHTTNLLESGFVKGEAYEAVYTITASNGREYHTSDIIYAGDYTVSLVLKNVDEAEYTVEYLSTAFTVQRRRVSAVPEGLQCDYNKKSPDLTKLGVEFSRADGQSPFVNDDGNLIGVVRRVYDKFGWIVNKPVNAGNYSISVESLISNDGSGFIENNYEIDTVNSERGTLTISPVLLIIAPQSQSTLYTGNSYYLNPNGYVLLGKNDLVDGDKLTVTADKHLDGTVGSVNIKIASYQIYDEPSGADMSGNYSVISSYDRNNQEIADLGLQSYHFMAALTYLARTVKVMQIPPEDMKQVTYTGKPIPIPYNDPNDLYYIESWAESGLSELSEDDYGLLAGHSLKVLFAQAGTKAGYDETKWITFMPYNQAGKSIPWAYKIVYDDDPDSFIYVAPADITVTVTIDLSGMEDGYILSENEFAVTSGRLLNSKEIMELKVVNGALEAEIYIPYGKDEYEGRNDMTSNYKVKIVMAGENESV